MRQDSRWIWSDGEWYRETDAGHPLISRALFYGAGCFETMGVRLGKLLHPERHFSRLQRGLEWLGVTSDRQPDTAQIPDRIDDLLERNKLKTDNASVRIQAALLGERGYSNPEQVTVQLSIAAFPFQQSGTDDRYRLMPVQTRTVPSVCRPANLKLSNMLHYMHAKQEANRNGYDDALMCNTDGYLAETSVANLFWRKNGLIFTPSEGCDILSGIMRGVVMDCLMELGQEVREGEFSPEELADAREVWVTNSLYGVRPVAGIAGRNCLTQTTFMQSLDSCLDSYMEEHQVQL